MQQQPQSAKGSKQTNGLVPSTSTECRLNVNTCANDRAAERKSATIAPIFSINRALNGRSYAPCATWQLLITWRGKASSLVMTRIWSLRTQHQILESPTETLQKPASFLLGAHQARLQGRESLGTTTQARSKDGRSSMSW